LELSEELCVGSALVSVEFSGLLNDQMVGFYRSSYSVDGDKRFELLLCLILKFEFLIVFTFLK